MFEGIDTLNQSDENKGKNNTANKAEHTSELSQVVTATAFEKAYAAFIDQADKNASSGKTQGAKTPYGFSEKPKCGGELFKCQYGQGTPSAAPYMNWSVVSIYYLPNSGDIIMGIEEDRYSHLKEMSIKPLRYAQIGNKKVSTAVFYSTNKSSVDYGELYEKFISVCEEVMRLGLHDSIIEGENKKNVVKSSQISNNRNPILNSPDDITEELIQAIIDNNLDSLTINYEFTRVQLDKEAWDDWKKEQYRTNPFWTANKKSELKRIEFEIILGENVHSLAYAFYYMSSLESVNLKDTSKVTDMRGMFIWASSFNQEIGNWDTSNVTHMNKMFYVAESFNQPIGDWDTSNVTDMRWMFAYAESFNQPIGDWDVSNVTNMSGMFSGSLFNGDISKWNVSNVEKMTGMFQDSKFNGDISKWNVSKVKDMSRMFASSQFNGDISKWDVSKVEDMNNMFKGATSYNQTFGDKKKNIDKSKYEYRIEISGRVSEYVCGSIKDDVWNYIKEEFNGDAEAYCEALDDGDVPEEFQLSDASYHLYENDNLFHIYGIELDSCIIEVSEWDEDEGFIEIDTDDFDVSNNTVPDEYHRIQYCFHKQYMIFESCEEGAYYFTLKLDEPIDISKLKLKLTECIWDLDGKSLVTGVIYDSEELEETWDGYEVSEPIITFYDEG